IRLPEHWFSEYRHLLEVAQPNGDGFRIPSYQAAILENLFQPQNRKGLDTLAAFEEIQEVELPQSLQAELRHYQLSGYHWLHFLKDFGLGGILADDMGLGKTLQTIAILLKEVEHGCQLPSLIVLPTSLIFNWVNEIQKFAPSLRYFVYQGTNRNKDIKYFLRYDVILTSYGIVRQDEEILQGFPFHYLILDESQVIKNRTAKITQAILGLRANHRLSLTGTPIENSTLDLWTQMQFLNPGLLGSETFFQDFYVNAIDKDGNRQRAEKLRRIIRPFILRRTKEQVATELPPKLEMVHYCELTETQQQIYDQTRSVYRKMIIDSELNSGYQSKLHILTGLQKLRQICLHSRLVEPQTNESGKYEEVWRMLEEILEKKAKVLIFSQYVKMLEIIKEDFQAKNIPFSYIDGSTRNRGEEVATFQTDESVQVFLISLKAGGVGLNLTAAEYVFILDPWWNPAIERQAIDRAYRIGQTKTVFAYKFISRGTIEEKILMLQQRKAKIAEDLIQTDEEIIKSLSKEELIALFD
ncbi:MAG: DEAD/DEAH box helicase, partial [Bacteroidia bacterium]|nr:DEAD/DEAH box helicase [Bacteroidia bacterium]